MNPSYQTAPADQNGRVHTQRALLCLILCIAGPLVSSLAWVDVLQGDPARSWTLVLTCALCGLCGAGVFGRSGLTRSLAGWPSLRWMFAGLLGIALTFAWFAVLRVLWDSAPQSPAPHEAPAALGWASFLHLALLPSISEEWLIRGVLWQACRRVSKERMTILITAAAFTVLHAWAGPLSPLLPLTFGLGLITGWLRARSGSLVPPLLTHLGYNTVILLLAP